jgi:threonine dehydratase
MTALSFAESVLENEPWVPTPLLPAQSIGHKLDVDLWLKREDCTPVGSFKLRGALVAMARSGDELTDRGIYVASAGNYGLAIAVAGQRRGIDVTVVVPARATPSKLERIRLSGATVIEHDDDFDGAKEFAANAAVHAGAAFWEDGVIQEMSDGAGTITSELLTHPNPWDHVLVPIGNGSLMKGIATVFKRERPATRVIGLVPSGAPSMAQALRGETWDETVPMDTVADGLAVRIPIRPIVEELKPLVDDVWLVDDSRLLPAALSLMELEQVMVEPSAAITVAGLADRHLELSGKRIAAIMTGAHLRRSLISELAPTEPLL